MHVHHLRMQQREAKEIRRGNMERLDFNSSEISPIVEDIAKEVYEAHPYTTRPWEHASYVHRVAIRKGVEEALTKNLGKLFNVVRPMNNRVEEAIYATNKPIHNSHQMKLFDGPSGAAYACTHCFACACHKADNLAKACKSKS